MKNTPMLVIGLVVIATVAAVGFAGYAATRVAPLPFWNNTEIACISGHDNLALHTHATLTVTVDDKAQTVPANIGISSRCMAELHTHETDGEIHMESATEGKTFTVQDFFTVWDTPIIQPNYTLTATVNGVAVADIGTHVMQDGDKINIAYTSGQTITVTTPPAGGTGENLTIPSLTGTVTGE